MIVSDASRTVIPRSTSAAAKLVRDVAREFETRDGYTETGIHLLALADRLDMLRNAVIVPGPEPMEHMRTLIRHREEWPTLWRSITALARSSE